MRVGANHSADIGTNDLLARGEDVMSCELDGEIVIMSIDNGCYYNLNGTASRVWDLLETGLTLDELCGKLVEDYDLSPSDCVADVADLLADLRRFGLVDVQPRVC